MIKSVEKGIFSFTRLFQHRRQQELRILHSPHNIADQMGVISRVQQKLGYYARSCNYTNNPFGYKCDETLNLEELYETSEKLEKLPEEIQFPDPLKERISYDADRHLLSFKRFMSKKQKNELLQLSEDPSYKKAVKRLFKNSLRNKRCKDSCILRFFQDAIKKYDVFHFHFGLTLLPKYEDLPRLKKMNKKMVMHFWGSEVRQRSILEKKNPYYSIQARDEDLIQYRLTKISKYIKTAIVTDYELYPYVQDYFDKVVLIRQAINLREFEPTFPTRDCKKPHIVHAPSNKPIKGTEHVLNAISELSKDYDFEFTLVHGLSHKDAKKIYSKADITIDQLLVGSYGLFAIESMALGKPVICYIREDLKDNYPGLPIVLANPENIKESLKRLISDAELRHELGKRGRAYVEQNHDAEKIAMQLIELYRSL